MKYISISIIIFSLIPSLAGATESSVNNFISKYADVKPLSIGPNCFGTAIASTTHQPYRGYIDEIEFQLMLNSPLCNEAPPEKTPSMNSILTVMVTSNTSTGLKTEAIHASVYRGNNTVFEKKYNGLEDMPTVKSMTESLKPYTTKNFLDIRSTMSQSLNTEGTWVLSHNCEPLQVYLKRELPELMSQKDIKKFWKRFSFESEDLQKWTQQKRPPIDAASALSRRMINIQDQIYRSIMLKQGLLKEEQLSDKALMWSKFPKWAVYLMAQKVQNMNRQAQFVIGAKVLENNGQLE